VIWDWRDVTREKQVRGGQRRVKWVGGRNCRRADKLIKELGPYFALFFVGPVAVAAAKSWLRVCEAFRSAARSFFLPAVTNAVEIVAVLHGSRDIERIFEGHAKHSDPRS
jgi:hypothetical protein